MRRSGMVWALALAVPALTGDGAFAATNLNSSKSNVYKFAPTDTVAANDCSAKGGVISTGTGGYDTCTLPAGSISLNFAPADTVAANDCTATGGIVTTGADGQKVCTKAAATTASPTTTREPHN